MSEMAYSDIEACYPDLVERYECGKLSRARLNKVALARRMREIARAEGKPTPHYTRYNEKIISHIEARLRGTPRMILDPMAGTLERLRRLERMDAGGHLVWGVEYEADWVRDYPHPRLVQGDCREMPFEDGFFDVIVVSPSYGNRDADRSGDWFDNADRKTYAGALGRNVSDGSLCLQWGREYREGHLRAWNEATRVLKMGGLFVLNCKSHVRQGRIVPVTAFHTRALVMLGCEMLDLTSIPTSGRHSGANSDVRAEESEQIIVFTKAHRKRVSAEDIQNLVGGEQ